MLEPHNIFAFEDGSTLFIFVAFGDFSISALKDFTNKATDKHIPTDVVLLHLEDAIEKIDLEESKKNIKLRFKCPLKTIQFSSDGKCKSTAQGKLVKRFIETGLNEVITRRNPIIPAPPGRLYQKPSGGTEAYFIHAAKLFERHAEMSFLALLLIREWGILFNENIRTIYIDTIDLYGIVSLAIRMRFPEKTHHPITVSFSSYNNFKETLKWANVDESLMVISATTSHGLLKSIFKKTKWKQEARVITVLVIKGIPDPKGITPRFLKALTSPNQQKTLNSLPPVRISGERFTIDVDKPKRVKLGTQHIGKHLESASLSELVKMKEVFSVYGKNLSDGSRFPILVNAEALIKDPNFKKWLSTTINKHAPASTTKVVPIGIEYDQIKDFFNLIANKPQELKASEIAKVKSKIDGSILVICPAFSTGAKLLEVSRDLRRHISEDCNIVYILGIGTLQSRASYNTLVSNLTIPDYSLFCYSTMYTGATQGLVQSWDLEHRYIRSHSSLNSCNEINLRKDALEDGGLRNDVFFDQKSLRIDKGFQYWKGTHLYDTPEKNAAALLLTLAAILQGARENGKLPEKDQLRPLHNRRVLLDPENFFRFNDTMIQAALIRAATPADLDYSDSKEASEAICYLLKRSISTSERSIVYEILIAIVTQKIQVDNECYIQIKEALKGADIDICSWFLQTEFFNSVNKS